MINIVRLNIRLVEETRTNQLEVECRAAVINQKSAAGWLHECEMNLEGHELVLLFFLRINENNPFFFFFVPET